MIPVAGDKGMGIIGMKVYLRGLATKLPGFASLEPFYRYALSQPITTAVIGCDIEQLQENVRLATSFKIMSAEEQRELADAVFPYARQLMYYKP